MKSFELHRTGQVRVDFGDGVLDALSKAVSTIKAAISSDRVVHGATLGELRRKHRVLLLEKNYQKDLADAELRIRDQPFTKRQAKLFLDKVRALANGRSKVSFELIKRDGVTTSMSDTRTVWARAVDTESAKSVVRIDFSNHRDGSGRVATAVLMRDMQEKYSKAKTEAQNPDVTRG